MSTSLPPEIFFIVKLIFLATRKNIFSSFAYLTPCRRVSINFALNQSHVAYTSDLRHLFFIPPPPPQSLSLPSSRASSAALTRTSRNKLAVSAQSCWKRRRGQGRETRVIRASNAPLMRESHNIVAYRGISAKTREGRRRDVGKVRSRRGIRCK